MDELDQLISAMYDGGRELASDTLSIKLARKSLDNQVTLGLLLRQLILDIRSHG